MTKPSESLSSFPPEALVRRLLMGRAEGSAGLCPSWARVACQVLTTGQSQVEESALGWVGALRCPQTQGKMVPCCAVPRHEWQTKSGHLPPYEAGTS